MLTIKKVTLTGAVLCLSILSYAQAINVKKETARIKGENTEGYGLELNGTSDEVTTSLLKYLKSIGKIKQSDGVVMLTESLSMGSNTKSPVYAMVKERGTGAQAWIGVLPNEWPADQAEKLDKELAKALHEFGIKYYKEKIQAEIDQSNQALSAVEKQQQKLVTENKTLNNKVESNQKEKLRLEKNLEDNKLEYENLLKSIERNKLAQDSVAMAGEQIKKVIEQQKERQGKVN